MSDIFRADDTTDAFKKAVEKGTEVQRDFIKQYSATQQDIMQNFLSMLQGLTYYYAMFKTTVQTGGRISSDSNTNRKKTKVCPRGIIS